MKSILISLSLLIGLSLSAQTNILHNRGTLGGGGTLPNGVKYTAKVIYEYPTNALPNYWKTNAATMYAIAGSTNYVMASGVYGYDAPYAKATLALTAPTPSAYYRFTVVYTNKTVNPIVTNNTLTIVGFTNPP